MLGTTYLRKELAAARRRPPLLPLNPCSGASHPGRGERGWREPPSGKGRCEDLPMGNAVENAPPPSLLNGGKGLIPTFFSATHAGSGTPAGSKRRKDPKRRAPNSPTAPAKPFSSCLSPFEPPLKKQPSSFVPSPLLLILSCVKGSVFFGLAMEDSRNRDQKRKPDKIRSERQGSNTFFLLWKTLGFSYHCFPLGSLFA